MNKNLQGRILWYSLLVGIAHPLSSLGEGRGEGHQSKKRCIRFWWALPPLLKKLSIINYQLFNGFPHKIALTTVLKRPFPTIRQSLNR